MGSIKKYTNLRLYLRSLFTFDFNMYKPLCLIACSRLEDSDIIPFQKKSLDF